MKTKSLVIGSAMALAAATGGARAADTVVFAAAPEPVDYVRICDVYGAGFFYIPGTETCLKISGYVRYEIHSGTGEGGYDKHARTTLVFDTRNETSWGTLRGLSELRFNQNWGDNAANGVGTTSSWQLAKSYIQLQQSMGTWELGVDDDPYATFLGYGANGVYDGNYWSWTDTFRFSYTFTGSNGFSAIVAATEGSDDVTNWVPNVEGGVNFSQGWGSIGAIAGYDESAKLWGAKAVARFNFNSMFSGGVHVFYSSGNQSFAGGFPSNALNAYAIVAPLANVTARWSVMVHAAAQVTPTVQVQAHFQWFDPANGAANEYEVAGGLNLTPVTNLSIKPELRYRWNGAASRTDGIIRVDKSF